MNLCYHSKESDYKRYKIMNYEMKDSISELKAEADKIVLDFNTTGSAIFDGKK